MPRKPNPTKGNFIVRVRCTVVKDVVVEDCTEAEAREEPWEHAVLEEEVDQEDWTVIDVKENS